MARAANSVHQNALHGTRSQAVAVPESHIASGTPASPKRLSPHAKKLFRQLCKVLSDRRALTEGDAETLRLYCSVWDRHRVEEAALREQGNFIYVAVTDSKGYSHEKLTANPRLQFVERAEKQMLALLIQLELGLTPITRDRAKPTAPGAPNALEITTADELIAAMKARGRA